jgi:hypothetical protein
MDQVDHRGNGRPVCRNANCTFVFQPVDLTRLHRFAVWKIEHVDPDCLQHGIMTRTTIAADLRYGD